MHLSICEIAFFNSLNFHICILKFVINIIKTQGTSFVGSYVSQKKTVFFIERFIRQANYQT